MLGWSDAAKYFVPDDGSVEAFLEDTLAEWSALRDAGLRAVSQLCIDICIYIWPSARHRSRSLTLVSPSYRRRELIGHAGGLWAPGAWAWANAGHGGMA